MNLTLYAIKEISTGKFMPAGRGRGFTHDEPKPAGARVAPRLFVTKRAAACALTWWLKGTCNAWYSDGYPVGPDDSIPQPHTRKAKDMKVVPVTLREMDAFEKSVSALT